MLMVEINKKRNDDLNKKLDVVYDIICKKVEEIDNLNLNVGYIETNYFDFNGEYTKNEIGFLNLEHDVYSPRIDILEDLVYKTDTKMLIKDFNNFIIKINEKIMEKDCMLDRILEKTDT